MGRAPGPSAEPALQPAPSSFGGPDKCVPLSHGTTRDGKLKARLHQRQASERFSDDLTCNGLQMRFTRVDMDLDQTKWDTLMRTGPAQNGTPAPNGNFSLFSNPIVAVDGDTMNQSSHNAGFMCDSDGRVVMYGGRIGNIGADGRNGPYGLHHGLLRWTGRATSDGVAWGPPFTVMSAEKARSLDCTDGRPDWESCELDGKLSAVEFKGRVLLFARFNFAYGLRSVQVASAPSASPGNLSQFEVVELEGEAVNTTNVYFANVRRSAARDCHGTLHACHYTRWHAQHTPESMPLASVQVVVRADGEKLVGLFPGSLRGEGGVWLSESVDGVHWGRPLRLIEVPVREDGRTDLHPVGGFSASADGAITFEVDHRVNLDHACAGAPIHAPELLCDPDPTLDHPCLGAKLYLPEPLCDPSDYSHTCSYAFAPTTPASQPASVQPAAAQPAAAQPAAAQPVAPTEATAPVSAVDTDTAQPASSADALSAAGYRGLAYL